MVNGAGGDKTGHDKTQRYIAASDAVIGVLSEQVQSMHGPRVWMDISPRFYTTFWTLSLYDLQVPSDAYVREIAKLKQSIAAIESDAVRLFSLLCYRSTFLDKVNVKELCKEQRE